MCLCNILIKNLYALNVFCFIKHGKLPSLTPPKRSNNRKKVVLNLSQIVQCGYEIFNQSLIHNADSLAVVIFMCYLCKLVLLQLNI